jgi:hypothetical protein
MSEDRISYYVSEARKFLEAAFIEFERGEKECRDVLIRDAAEKAWNAIIQATNALLLSKGFPEEKIRSHRDRRLALNSLELRGPEMRAKGFRDRFGAGEHYLHEMCFYEGEYLPEGVKDDLLKARSYIEDVEKALKG